MIKVINCHRVAVDEFSLVAVDEFSLVAVDEISVVAVDEFSVVAVDEFSSVVDDGILYIFASFRMSFSLNPTIWPIVAFGSYNINRQLHFSYRPTRYS